MMEAQSEMKRGDVEHHSKTTRWIKELISNQVDLSSITLSNASVNCSGLNLPPVTSYGTINAGYCLNHWNYSQDAWRAKKYQCSTHLDAESAVLMGCRWIQTDGDDDGITFECPSCTHTINHAKQRHSKQLNSSSWLPKVEKSFVRWVWRFLHRQSPRIN